jgi:hypothetical protein
MDWKDLGYFYVVKNFKLYFLYLIYDIRDMTGI